MGGISISIYQYHSRTPSTLSASQDQHIALAAMRGILSHRIQLNFCQASEPIYYYMQECRLAYTTYMANKKSAWSADWDPRTRLAKT
jgi:hypothetical protein